MPAWDILVKGKVQGVGFRRFVYDTAHLYSVRGYVRNLADGSVQILAIAEAGVLNEFCSHVRQACYYARVVDMDISVINGAKEYHDFSIR